MRDYLYIAKTLRLLWKHQPGRLVLIFMLTLIMGINSGFSVVLLIPMLQLLDVGGGVAEGPALFFNNLAAKAGISLTLETVLVVYVFLLTLTALLQYWKSRLDTGYQQSFIYGLRRRLFRKIILTEWPVISGRSKTNHLQVLTSEVPNLAVYYHYFMRLATTFITGGAYLVYAMMVSARFTVIIIVAGAVLFFVLRKYISRAFHLGEESVSSYYRLLKYIDDFWQTIKIAKVHSSEDFYYNKFDEANSSLFDLELRMQKNWSLPQMIYRIAGIMVLVLIVYFGYNSGEMPLASFFVLILLFSRIFPMFVSVNTDISMIISNLVSVKMVIQLDEELPDTDFIQTKGGRQLRLEKEIRLEKIGFSYPDGERLFEAFSAVINANRITGILGASGRGKTTLIDIIAGLQRPDSGRVLIDGVDLGGGLVPSWKSGIGYLPQDPFFIDGTIRENLIWDSGDEVTDKEIYEVLRQVNAIHLVNRFEKRLDTFLNNYSFIFSGGECQRLALARVLLRRPSLLLLDEATSSLDAENEAVIMEVLEKLKGEVTVIFVTHRESVSRWFDSVIKL